MANVNPIKASETYLKFATAYHKALKENDVKFFLSLDNLLGSYGAGKGEQKNPPVAPYVPGKIVRDQRIGKPTAEFIKTIPLDLPKRDIILAYKQLFRKEFQHWGVDYFSPYINDSNFGKATDSFEPGSTYGFLIFPMRSGRLSYAEGLEFYRMNKFMLVNAKGLACIGLLQQDNWWRAQKPFSLDVKAHLWQGQVPYLYAAGYEEKYQTSAYHQFDYRDSRDGFKEGDSFFCAYKIR